MNIVEKPEKQWHIYAMVNSVNGKIYIGQTRRNYLQRISEHFHRSDGCPLLKKAIEKYGKEKFIPQLLDVAYSQKEANFLERMWIRLYKTYEKTEGYNLSMGGSFGSFNKETLAKMSESHKGEKNNFFGKRHSEETKKKMSADRKGRHANEKHPRARKVKCIETGEVFNCIKEAGEKSGANRHHISQVCLKQHGRKTAGGFHWEYE